MSNESTTNTNTSVNPQQQALTSTIATFVNMADTFAEAFCAHMADSGIVDKIASHAVTHAMAEYNCTPHQVSYTPPQEIYDTRSGNIPFMPVLNNYQPHPTNGYSPLGMVPHHGGVCNQQGQYYPGMVQISEHSEACLRMILMNEYAVIGSLTQFLNEAKACMQNGGMINPARSNLTDGKVATIHHVLRELTALISG